MSTRICALLAVLALLASPGFAQSFTHADSLRGSNGPGRAWWDVTFYDLQVAVSPSDSSLSGEVAITYRTLAASQELQLDLQPPMQPISVIAGGVTRKVRQDGNAWFVDMPAQGPDEVHTITARFEGKPRLAVRPPWDGGYQWITDSAGTPWVATSNQGLGASIWWPNQDFQADEPDSQRTAITVPSAISAVSNGRLEQTRDNGDGTTTFTWFVSNPINNYSIEVNARDYAHWTETHFGGNGPLTMDFWPLRESLARARAQWEQARTTIAMDVADRARTADRMAIAAPTVAVVTADQSSSRILRLRHSTVRPANSGEPMEWTCSPMNPSAVMESTMSAASTPLTQVRR
jgi:aminopeptidase N